MRRRRSDYDSPDSGNEDYVAPVKKAKQVDTPAQKLEKELTKTLKPAGKAMKALEKAVASGGSYQAAATDLKDIIDDALETAED